LITFPNFRRVQSTDKDLNLVQDQLGKAFALLAGNPFIAGHFLPQVPLVQGQNLISHSLGRAYISWGPLRPSAALHVYEIPSPDATKYVNLVASGPGTQDIYVF
jgi:hypothetical protein